MGKVTEHQNEFERRIKTLLSNYKNIDYINSPKSKYLSLKINGKVLLTIYFRAAEIRVYIDNNNKLLKLYEELLKECKVYQHDTADGNNVKEKFAFYADESNELEVVKRYIEIMR